MNVAINIDDFILKYEYIIDKVIWNSFSKVTNEYNIYDELMQEGRFALLKARDTYIEGLQSFSSYAYRCVFNEISTYIKVFNNIRDNKNTSLNDLVKIEDNQEITYEDIIYTCDDLSKIDSNYNDILKFISTKDIITKRIAFYTLKGYTQREIGELLGMKERNINTRVYKLRDEIAKEFNINLKYNKTNGKVIAIELDGDFIGEYENLNEAEKMLGCDKNTIRKLAQKVKGRKGVYSKVLKRKITFRWS